MKYKDADINLVKSSSTIKYTDLVPRKNYMYLKILNDSSVLTCTGDISKSVFKKYNKFFVSKNLRDINIVFFNDYIFNLVQRVAEDCSAYQFNFQHKGGVVPYVCSIYPCMAFDECKSFDVVIRQLDSKRSNNGFFVSLQNSAL